MKIYINYSDKIFKTYQDFALKMANKKGGFDKVVGYTREDIDKKFYKENKDILDQKRGGGYWLWKPYFIYKSLEKINVGDYLFYSDAGVFFLKNVDILINELEKYSQDIMGFELPLIESQWTKKELFINMNCCESKYKDSNQILASFQLIKKTEQSMQFYKEYLKYACNESNITDIYDKNIKQDDDFIDHRHDQSIFSLLYKKYNLRPFKDPTQLGKYPCIFSGTMEKFFVVNKLHILQNGRKFRYFNYNEQYAMVLFHNRKNKPIQKFIKFKIKEILYKLGLNTCRF